MPLINCKIHLELNWTKDCVMYGHNTCVGGDNNNKNNNNNNNNRETTFKIINTKLYVPIVTLSTKNNVNLTKLNEELKRPVYWNEYKTKIETRNV